MNLYVAGLYTTGYSCQENTSFYRKASPNARELRKAIGHHLESYHYIHKGRYVDLIAQDGKKVFLDSGAFSAFSLGVDISIEAYADFVKGHSHIIEMASVLDAIGDPEGTYRNQKRLEQLGAEVLPCFHYGEPLDLCEHYVKNYKYMTIGGMVPIPNNKLEPWLDEVWGRVLTDSDGLARTKVHGFGLTARSLMAKYPWYSVDSSSWVQVGANGGVVIPELPQPIAISDRSPRRKDFMGHYSTLPPETRGHVERLLNYYGMSPEEVATDYRARWSLNAYAYYRLGELLGDDHWRRPFKAKQPGLFDA